MSNNTLDKNKGIPYLPPLTWNETNHNWKFIDEHLQEHTDIQGYSGALRVEHIQPEEPKGRNGVIYNSGIWKYYYRNTEGEFVTIELTPNSSNTKEDRSMAT